MYIYIYTCIDTYYTFLSVDAYVHMHVCMHGTISLGTQSKDHLGDPAPESSCSEKRVCSLGCVFIAIPIVETLMFMWCPDQYRHSVAYHKT